MDAKTVVEAHRSTLQMELARAAALNCAPLESTHSDSAFNGCTIVFAQGASTSSLSGIVVDSNGGAVPGATVVVKDRGTNTTYDAVTSAEGVFNVPALTAGNYSVTITLNGFKTVNNIGFDPATTVGPGATIFQTTTAYTDLNNTFDPGGRLGMLVFRINW